MSYVPQVDYHKGARFLVCILQATTRSSSLKQIAKGHNETQQSQAENWTCITFAAMYCVQGKFSFCMEDKPIFNCTVLIWL